MVRPNEIKEINNWVYIGTFHNLMMFRIISQQMYSICHAASVERKLELLFQADDRSNSKER